MAARSRRPRRLAKFFGRGPDAAAATRLQLSPRRLEARRMLDAAAPALALEMADLSSEYVQASPDYAPLELTANEGSGGDAVNSPPANIQVQSLATIDENGVATLELVFEDADPLDAHTVEVDWGDGAVEVFNVSPGSNFFGTTHQYLDDDPSVTSSDVYNVGVKVTDSAGAFTTESAPITVNNVAPSNLQIAPMAPISENGIGNLELTFDDPGSLDAHTVEVDWGDGNVEIFNVPQGSRFFGTTHQYLDDDPSGTSADDYSVNVRVLDDDGGVVGGSATVNVSNAAPSNLVIAPIADIDEHGFAQLSLTFDDPGTLDTHKVEVDWGDGTVEVLDVTPGNRSFDATHQYLDDNPTGTASDQYAVSVRLLDDDLGEISAAPVTVRVHNVAPSGLVIDPLAPIDENGVAVLNLVFTDPGTLDSHTVEVDWGDGSGLEIVSVPAGARAIAISHQYLDDNPSGTPADVYAINVKVGDDDGGLAVGATSIAVNNVAPAVVLTPLSTSQPEGTPFTFTLTASDPGQSDALSYTINWGDGNVSTGVATQGDVVLSHTYADDGIYTVTATVKDDDSGVGMAEQTLTVTNAAPTLVATPSTSSALEGQQISFSAMFSDPGYDNPLNAAPGLNNGPSETLESFSYSIDWGDKRDPVDHHGVADVGGAAGAPSTGSFGGSHVYADDGVYTVTITIFDDDGGQDIETFLVTVTNDAPDIVVSPSTSTSFEGQLVSFTAQFSDDGFDNSLNMAPGLANGPSETFERFTYSIDWGDNRDSVTNQSAPDANGGPGVSSTGSFGGSHTYADDGVYTVTVTVFDDDGGQDVATFTVTVTNVAPALVVTPSTTSSVEGQEVSFAATFSDHGFDNALNMAPGLNNGPSETFESFVYSIDWGDKRDAITHQDVSYSNGTPGAPSTGSFGGSHTYADDGVYTITVTIIDDDSGQDVRMFTVTVANAAPTLAVTPSTTASVEGQQISFAATFSDNGFDNALNMAPGLNGSPSETFESFTYSIDWGDSRDAVNNEGVADAGGMPGAPSTGAFGGSHTYADDGVYTVTVTVLDDDGGVDVQTYVITIGNVAPTLTLTFNPNDIAAIDEGGTTVVNFAAIFSDPGFDNGLNAAPGLNGSPSSKFESFTYAIDWGDGKGDNFSYAPGDVPDYDPNYLPGMPGAPTTGSIVETFQHRYTDNDLDGTKDARYTVTVTLMDDDGGVSVRTFEVIVYNVDPHLEPPPTLQATTVNREGQTTLQLVFTDPRLTDPADPNEESFEILIDWENDGTFVVERFVPTTDPQVGDAPRFYAFTHTYLAPPNPDNPAADITITVKIRDDDFGTATSRPENRDLAANPLGALDGQSNIESVKITNTGLGGAPFRIDTTPQVALLTFPERVAVQPEITSDEIRAAVATANDEGGSAGDSRAVGERYLELRVINPDGSESEGYRLRPEVLRNLQSLFRNLPDNRYAIYLVQSETEVRRLVIDVFVRNGKVIDPGDDSEGARDRPPTDESTTSPTKPPEPQAPPQGLPTNDDVDAGAAIPLKTDLPAHPRSATAIYHRSALARVALALTGAGTDWQRAMQQTIAAARPDQWKQLRMASRRRRRKPR